eukprot:gene5906-6147_t
MVMHQHPARQDALTATESTFEDLEEPLLFEFEQEEHGSAFAAAAAAAAPGSGGFSDANGPLSPMTSAAPSQLSLIRSITKDAAGVHVQTESFVMHIEEERATSTTWQAAFNAVNILCGVGLLTTPYAMAITGISSLLLLMGIGAIACYTGRLLALCMTTSPAIRTYPDIGQAAFGRFGRLLVSVLLYLELFSCCVDFLILEGDNLSAVFPGAAAKAFGYTLTAKQTLILLAAVAVLPTVWLRDMSLLSYLSVGGIFASVALLVLVGWEAVAITGFPHDQPPLVTWPGVPISIGLFCFCFSGHAVFPSLYASMRTKAHFPWLLVMSFSVVVLIYGSMAVMGALMFGPDVSENITLDMQQAAPRAVPTVLAMWLVIINPVAKIALTLAPVAMAVEELLEVRHGTWQFIAASVTLRTALLAVVVATAIAGPRPAVGGPAGYTVKRIDIPFTLPLQDIIPPSLGLASRVAGASGLPAMIIDCEGAHVVSSAILEQLFDNRYSRNCSPREIAEAYTALTRGCRQLSKTLAVHQMPDRTMFVVESRADDPLNLVRWMRRLHQEHPRADHFATMTIMSIIGQLAAAINHLHQQQSNACSRAADYDGLVHVLLYLLCYGNEFKHRQLVQLMLSARGRSNGCTGRCKENLSRSFAKQLASLPGDGDSGCVSEGLVELVMELAVAEAWQQHHSSYQHLQKLLQRAAHASA